jgi:hypothetical protein
MSITEMKLKVIKKITSLEDESILKNILIQLDKNEGENEKENKPLNLSQHFESISKQYDNTLKKLAQ